MTGTPRQYATAGAFRTGLETRLIERARRDAVDLQRLRRQVAFDRLLARMFDPSLSIRQSWVLKGGYADELLPPPGDWARPFAALVLECGLDQTLDGAYERLRGVWTALRPR